MYPQRSVMTCGLATALEPPHFNPRTRVGCNRARMAGYGRFHASFNPRACVGCDLTELSLSPREAYVSIHAPAWGATAVDMVEAAEMVVSIHAPA